MKKRVLAALLAAVLSLSMMACGAKEEAPAEAPAEEEETPAEAPEEEPAEDIKIGVLLKPESNEYWASMKAGLIEWDEATDGVTVEVLCAESEDNITGQLEQLENMISKDYDAICAAPLSASNLVEGIIKACEAGIPIVNVDELVDAEAVKEGGGNMVGAYTTDNVVVGQTGGKFIVDQLGGSGEVAIIEGTAGNINSQNRSAGAKEALEAGGCEVVASQPGDWDRLVALDVATNIMQSNPELKAFYCANDTMALGVYEAVVNAGKEDSIIVVGTDAVQGAKESVNNGELAATVGQNNVQIGIACVELAVKAVQEGWVADPAAEMPLYYIDAFLVTPENAADYL